MYKCENDELEKQLAEMLPAPDNDLLSDGDSDDEDDDDDVFVEESNNDDSMKLEAGDSKYVLIDTIMPPKRIKAKFVTEVKVEFGRP